MNNSLDRIYEAMSAALRRDILPCLDDPHARRQAVAMIDVINHLRLKTDWSVDPLRETVSAQIEALRRLSALFDGSPVRAPPHQLPSLPEPAPSISELMTMRDELDQVVSLALEWLDQHRDELGGEAAGAATALLRTLIDERLQRELQLTPKPLFGEM
jgi:hypothetical protein